MCALELRVFGVSLFWRLLENFLLIVSKNQLWGAKISWSFLSPLTSSVRFLLVLLGCGGVQVLTDTGVTYQIQSPNYPVRLPTNTECEWTLQVPENNLIVFEFRELNLTRPCTDTYLEISSGGASTKYCGTDLSSTGFIYRSTASTMNVRLRTGRNQVVHPGFSATWRVGCGTTMTTAKGVIASPTLPNGGCLYTIILPEIKKQVVLHFNYFDLDTTPGCSDYVKVSSWPFSFSGITFWKCINDQFQYSGHANKTKKKTFNPLTTNGL